jgi:hypothetical protein
MTNFYVSRLHLRATTPFDRTIAEAPAPNNDIISYPLAWEQEMISFCELQLA